MSCAAFSPSAPATLRGARRVLLVSEKPVGRAAVDLPTDAAALEGHHVFRQRPGLV